jgi:hypothetical protein
VVSTITGADENNVDVAKRFSMGGKPPPERLARNPLCNNGAFHSPHLIAVVDSPFHVGPLLPLLLATTRFSSLNNIHDEGYECRLTSA